MSDDGEIRKSTVVNIGEPMCGDLPRTMRLEDVRYIVQSVCNRHEVELLHFEFDRALRSLHFLVPEGTPPDVVQAIWAEVGKRIPLGTAVR